MPIHLSQAMRALLFTALATTLVLATPGRHVAFRHATHQDAPAWDVPEPHARLRGRVGTASARNVTHHILAAMASGRTHAYLVIDSLGGDIVASVHLSATLALATSAGLNVTCLVHGWAGSAAFTVLQHCTTRFVTPTAVLMQHRARATGRGRARAAAVADLAICRLEARRIGVPVEEWVAAVNAGVEASGADAVARGFADAVVRHDNNDADKKRERLALLLALLAAVSDD